MMILIHGARIPDVCTAPGHWHFADVQRQNTGILCQLSDTKITIFKFHRGPARARPSESLAGSESNYDQSTLGVSVECRK